MSTEFDKALSRLPLEHRIKLKLVHPRQQISRAEGPLQVGITTYECACQFVLTYHRHSGAPQGHLFSLVAFDEGGPKAYAIVGRPVSRHQDDGRTVEITRLATGGRRNACSKLYSAARREAYRRGYDRVITYTLESESGASLRAAGWVLVASGCGGGQWSSPTRPRRVTKNDGPKNMWTAPPLRRKETLQALPVINRRETTVVTLDSHGRREFHNGRRPARDGEAKRLVSAIHQYADALDRVVCARANMVPGIFTQMSFKFE